MTENSKQNDPRIYVQTQYMKPDLPGEGFRLKSGEYLKSLEIAYESYGELNAEKNNAILICTPLTMDAHAAGWYSDEDSEPGWWDEVIGSDKSLDTDRYCVIVPNVLGGCKGTTGPSSINPATGKPYGSDFPRITLEDMVNVQALLLTQLGITGLAAVIGGSMGGMLALQWSVAYPQMVRKCICIAASTKLSPQALGFEIVGRKVLTSDNNFFHGDYYNKKAGPDKGLSFARMIGLLTYLSAGSMQEKFGRKTKHDFNSDEFETGFEVENYLKYNADKFTQRFDANSYLQITYAMDTFDMETNHGSLKEAFQNTQAEFLIVALSSDWLFPPQQSRDLCGNLLNLKKITSFVELNSPYGHDAFLLEIGNLGKVMNAFLTGSEIKSAQSEPAPAVVPSSSSLDNMVIDAGDYFKHLKDLIEPGCHILDIGCGTGELVDSLYRCKGITGFGIDIDLENAIECFEKDVPVIHGDVDNGLTLFGDDSFDYAVMSQTLQMLKKPDFVLNEMLRVARKGIVVFPNFGNIDNRIYLGLKGAKPVTPGLPYNWWESPNMHLFSFRDFIDLCKKLNMKTEEVIPICTSPLSRFFLKFGGINLGAEHVIVKFSRA